MHQDVRNRFGVAPDRALPCEGSLTRAATPRLPSWSAPAGKRLHGRHKAHNRASPPLGRIDRHPPRVRGPLAHAEEDPVSSVGAQVAVDDEATTLSTTVTRTHARRYASRTRISVASACFTALVTASRDDSDDRLDPVIQWTRR